MFKFVVLCAAVAVARAGYLGSAAPSISYSSYAAAPALGYPAVAPALSYDTGYSRAIQATPAVGYSGFAAPAFRSFGNLAGYAAPALAAAPAVHTSSFGYAAATPFAYGRVGHAGLGYAAAPAIW